MKFLLASILLVASGPLIVGDDGTPKPPTTATSSAPSTTSRPAGPSPVVAAKIDRLIQRLGDRDFRTRERAQRELAALGDVALPQIAANLGHDNPEVAHRLKSLLRRPDDAALRVATAERLIASADPDWMETGVYMLFRDPIADADAFRSITDRSTGIERAMFEPIADQLDGWKRMTELHLRRQETLVKEKPEAAAKERKMHADSLYYEAEAAYWQAVEAAESYREEHESSAGKPEKPTTTQPARPKD